MPGLATLLRRGGRTYPLVLERRGGDHAIGRKLYRYLLAAGVPDPSLRLAQGVGTAGATKTLALSTPEATAEAILAEGLASEDELRSALASLEAFAADPTTVIGDPRTFQLWRGRPYAQPFHPPTHEPHHASKALARGQPLGPVFRDAL